MKIYYFNYCPQCGSGNVGITPYGFSICKECYYQD